MTLKHSREIVRASTERHDYQNECRAFKDCHHHFVTRPIAVASLAPDISAPWTIEAYRAGRDPAMESVETSLFKLAYRIAKCTNDLAVHRKRHNADSHFAGRARGQF